MSHSHEKSVPTLDLSGQTKILFSSPPGKVGLYAFEGKLEPKTFKDAHAALDWCNKNEVCFIFLPMERVGQN